jgi:opacity protein-like surface antigen
MRALQLDRIRLLLGLAAAMGVSAAHADGIEIRRGEKATYNWTGLYVGAHLGGGVNLIDVTDPLGPALFGNPIHSPGPFAGLQAGYNYQSGNFVYGVEADVSLPQMEGTGTCSAVNADIINSTCRLSTDALGTLTGRLGLALGPEGRALVYGKAGAAWSAGSFDIATGDMHGGEQGNPFAIKTAGLTQWGWTLGAGAEYALSSNWSVASEYDFTRFGDADVTLLPTAYLSSTGVVTGTVPARQGQVSQDTHAIKLGLNYRFGERVLQGSGFPEGTTASLNSTPLQVAGLPFGLELGGRYWYSWGRHKYDLGFPKAEFGSALADISRLTYGDLQSNTGELFGL